MWEFKGLDERIAENLSQAYGLKIKEALFDLPEEIKLLLFILLSAGAGFILGYNWYRIFKVKNK
jgi:hypothetical protein